jgi:hypothetical protein
MTNAGSFRLPVRGMMLPESYPLAEFRRVLALRCMEELANLNFQSQFLTEDQRRILLPQNK